MDFGKRAGDADHRFLLAVGLCFLALCMLLTVLWLDSAVLGRSIIAEDAPQFGATFLLRTALAVLASLLSVGAPLLLRSESGLPRPAMGKSQQAVVWLVAAASLSCVLLLAVSPFAFNWLSAEDGVVETLAVVFFFLASGVFGYTFFRLNKERLVGRSGALVALGLAGIFFLIGMEEISWFQRVFDLETPEFFAANMQDEMNLHNFETNKVENVYYLGAFLFLVAIPFCLDVTGLLRRTAVVRVFAPSLYVLLVSAPIFAYNYDMWNIVVTQYCFFATLFILFYYARQFKGASYAIILTLCCVIQLLFLTYGGTSVRLWDVTEYKETFIALAFLIYAVDILFRVWRLGSGNRVT